MHVRLIVDLVLAAAFVVVYGMVLGAAIGMLLAAKRLADRLERLERTPVLAKLAQAPANAARIEAAAAQAAQLWPRGSAALASLYGAVPRRSIRMVMTLAELSREFRSLLHALH